jgi:hypothetical protein
MSTADHLKSEAAAELMRRCQVYLMGYSRGSCRAEACVQGTGYQKYGNSIRATGSVAHKGTRKKGESLTRPYEKKSCRSIQESIIVGPRACVHGITPGVGGITSPYVRTSDNASSAMLLMIG